MLLPGYPPTLGDVDTGSDLWVIPTDGRPAGQLTHFAPAKMLDVVFCNSNGGVIPKVSHPEVSPDSRSVVFLSTYAHVRELGHEADIMAIALDGSGLHTVRRVAPVPCIGSGYGGHEGSAEIDDLLGWR